MGAASSGPEPLLVLVAGLGGVMVGTILGAALALTLTRRGGHEEPAAVARRMTPASLALEDDPIVAALVGTSRPPSRESVLPDEAQPS